MPKPSEPVYHDFSIFPGWLRCLFRGHAFGGWYPWHRDAPRIVFASLEYMNDRREFRDCARCGCQQMRK